jgi:Ca-activated chloride channel family protein
MLTYQKNVADRRGAMLPLVAMLLPVMLILSSFVINVAYMELTRTELRIVSDAATRAGGYAYSTTGARGQALQAAREAAQRNKVGGKITRLRPSDVEFGISTRSSLNQRYTFTPANGRVNSVRVNARRDAKSLSGAVAMIMPTFGAIKQFEPSQEAISTQVDLDVAIVLDRSGSMAYGASENSSQMASSGTMPASAPAGWSFCDPAPKGSRWLDLVAGVNVFLKELDKSPQMERLSLSTYASTAQAESPLEDTEGSVIAGMKKYTDSMCGGSTNIHDGIMTGLSSLENKSTARPWASKVIVLMTDGNRTAGDDPIKAAQAAKASNVTIYTVTFSDEADQKSMAAVAAATGGAHFHANSGQELKDAFAEIARRLPSLLSR